MLSLRDHHDSLELFSQTLTFNAIGLVFDQDLVDLSHFNAALDLFDFAVALLDLLALLSDGSLITVDKLLGLGVLLGAHHLTGAA